MHASGEFSAEAYFQPRLIRANLRRPLVCHMRAQLLRQADTECAPPPPLLVPHARCRSHLVATTSAKREPRVFLLLETGFLLRAAAFNAADKCH